MKTGMTYQHGHENCCEMDAEIARLHATLKEWTDTFGPSVEPAAIRWQELKTNVKRLMAEVERLTRDQDCLFCGVRDGHLHENWCRADWHSPEEWEYLNRELGKVEAVVRAAEVVLTTWRKSGLTAYLSEYLYQLADALAAVRGRG